MTALPSNAFPRAREILVAGVVAFLVVAGARLIGLLESTALAAYDRLLRLTPPVQSPESDIVLVRIDEDEIRRFGHPLCDALLARSISILLDAGASAVGIDLYRDAPVSRPCDVASGPVRSLERIVNGTDRVVMSWKFSLDDRTLVPPPPWLAGPDRAGFIDIPVDAGGRVRRLLLYQWIGERSHVSFALRLALRHLRSRHVTVVPDPEDPALVRIGDTTIPALDRRFGGYAAGDFGGYQYLHDYARRTPFPAVSLGELLSDNRVRAQVEGRIAIVGTASPSVKDSFYGLATFGTAESEVMYGMEVHARSVDQLLRFARGEALAIRSLSELGELAWILLWSLLGAATGTLLHRGAIRGALVGVAVLGAQGWAGVAAISLGLWIPVAPAALATLASLGLSTAYVAASERRERNQVIQLFSRFLRPLVAERIWNQRADFIQVSGRPRARRTSLAVLMADLEGYSATSERVTPQTLMEWVNDFLSSMANQVEAQSGIVDDYYGDGLKANFGLLSPGRDPDEGPRNALRAVRCAVAMGHAMELLNEGWAARGLPPGRLRVGVFAGPAIVGVIGGANSLKYTSVGDTVNTAAKLESFDKEGYTFQDGEACWRVLIGGETAEYVADEFQLEALGEFELPGKSQRITIHRVLGVRNRVREDSG